MLLNPLAEVILGVLMPIMIRTSQCMVNFQRRAERGQEKQHPDENGDERLGHPPVPPSHSVA